MNELIPSRSRSPWNFSTNQSTEPMKMWGEARLVLGQLDAGPRLHPLDDLARLAAEVVGDDDRPREG